MEGFLFLLSKYKLRGFEVHYIIVVELNECPKKEEDQKFDNNWSFDKLIKLLITKAQSFEGLDPSF